MKKIHWLEPIDKSNYQTFKAKKTHRWRRDPVGYFLLKADHKNKLIRIGFCTNDNVLKYEIVGKKPEDIYYDILNRTKNLSTEHAAYIGKELARVEFAIKNGARYTQDNN